MQNNYITYETQKTNRYKTIKYISQLNLFLGSQKLSNSYKLFCLKGELE